MKALKENQLRVAAASIALLFAGSLIWAVANLRVGDQLLGNRLIERVEWASWQVPFELSRLRNALLNVAIDSSLAARDAATLRLDVAASRIALLEDGQLRRTIESFGLVKEADYLISNFRRIDHDTAVLLREGQLQREALLPLTRAIQDHIGEFQQFAALMQTKEAERVSALIDEQSRNSQKLYVSLAGFLASGLFFAGYMISSNRRMQRLKKASELARKDALLSQVILEDAIEALPDGFALFDPEDRLVLCNENYRELYATSADHISVGTRFEEILRVGVRRRQYRDAYADPEGWIAARLASHLDPKGPQEQQLDDGRYLRVHEIKTKAGYIVGMRTDITGMRLAEMAVRQSEKRFRLAALATMDGLWEWVPETNDFWFSKTFCDMFDLGDTQASLEAWKLDLSDEDATALEAALKACAEGQIERFELNQVLKLDDRDERHVECRGMREAGEDGKTLRIVGAVNDATKRRQYEHKLNEAKVAAERVAETRIRFMAMISHEIRTPINGIMGALEAMSEGEHGPESRRYLKIAEESTEALRTLIDDVLDASKIDAGEFSLRMGIFSPADLATEVARLLAVRAEQAGLDLVVNIDPSIPKQVISDEARLRQVLMNLVGNAIKFTNSGGVEIRLEHSLIGCRQCDLRFSVIDTGIGIAVDQLDRLFTPFRQIDEGYRREFGGTGLGLSISQSIVQALGSEISCSSEMGHGSRFSFQLQCDRIEGAKPLYSQGLFKDMSFAVASVSPLLTRVLVAQIRKLGGTVVDEADKAAALDIAIMDDAMASSVHENLARADKTVRLGGSHWRAPYDLSDLVQFVFAGSKDRRKTKRQDEAAKGSIRFSGKHVLIAEDSLVNRELAEHQVERLGFTCVAVENGAQAVEAMRVGTFDLILMDVSMPVMDGIEAARHIREFSEIPIVGMTAHAFASVSDELSEAGFNAHLVKPYRKDELMAVCEQMLPLGESIDSHEPPDTKTIAVDVKDDVIDRRQLRDLEDDVGFETLSDLLGAFLDEMDARCTRIAVGLGKLDGDVVRYEAHALKSSARAFGAQKLSSLARELEMAARDGDVASIRCKRESLNDLAVATRLHLAGSLPKTSASTDMKSC